MSDVSLKTVLARGDEECRQRFNKARALSRSIRRVTAPMTLAIMGAMLASAAMVIEPSIDAAGPKMLLDWFGLGGLIQLSVGIVWWMAVRPEEEK